MASLPISIDAELGRRILRAVKWPLAGGALAFLAGLIASTGSPLFVTAFIALAVGFALLRFPGALMYSALITCMVLVGTAEIFLSFSQANWAASAVVGGLLLATIFSKPVSSRRSPEVRQSFGYGLFIGGAALYGLTMLISLGLNRPGFGQALAGIRNYWPFLGVFFILAFGRLPFDVIRRVSLGMLGIASIQWVYCVAQQLIIVPKRQAVMGRISGEAEAIVGSFGGNPMSGGYTGEMAAFMAVMMVCSAFLAIKSVLPKWVPYVVGLSFLVSVGLAETKIVFVLLPIVTFAILYRVPGGFDRALIKPVLAALVLVAVFGAIYWFKYWKDQGDFVHAFTYSFDPNFKVSEYERGRIGSLIHWWESMALTGDVPAMLLGFGPAASTAGSAIGGVGSAVLKFGLGLDNNAVTKLLWDFGVLGVIGVLLMIAGAYLTLIRLTNLKDINDSMRWLLVAVKGFIVAFAVMLPYQVSVLGGAPMQFLFWFALGLVAYAANWTGAPREPVRAVLRGRRS